MVLDKGGELPQGLYGTCTDLDCPQLELSAPGPGAGTLICKQLLPFEPGWDKSLQPEARESWGNRQDQSGGSWVGG